MHGLHYSHRTESGVLFHMIGAMSQFGKLGLTVIGNDASEVNELYQRAIHVLEAEPRSVTSPRGTSGPRRNSLYRVERVEESAGVAE